MTQGKSAVTNRTNKSTLTGKLSYPIEEVILCPKGNAIYILKIHPRNKKVITLFQLGLRIMFDFTKRKAGGANDLLLVGIKFKVCFKAIEILGQVRPNLRVLQRAER
jgi:hypothetical protein